MPVAHDLERADVCFGPDGVLGLLPGKDFEFMREFISRQVLKLLAQIAYMSFLDRNVEIAGLEIAVNAVFFNSLANDFVSGPAHFP